MESTKSVHIQNETGPAEVELIKTTDSFRLMVNKQPFFIKGAGLEYGDIGSLAEHHGNSFRTWRTDNGVQSARDILEEARRNGLMVCMGLDMGRERHGFDYDDDIQVQQQFERIRREVEELKDHPALLMWGIGNELNLKYTNPKVWDAVNEISKMIHEVDPNHLTTTSLSGIFKKELKHIAERCPDLDLLSFQLYGNLSILPRLVRKFGYTGAYIVSEWGATGHWEVPQTSWGAPIEENSTLKAENYLERYKTTIASDPTQCVGSYVFLWGDKQERTPTWYGMFLESGEATETVDVMHFLWSGSWPENRAPRIISFKLDGKIAEDNIHLNINQSYPARIELSVFTNKSVSYRWEVLPESTDLKEGGDPEEKPEAISDAIHEQNENEAILNVPRAGNFRLFVYAVDGDNRAATANIPFRVF
ncbi:glycoside hydrolase family 2 TIM barrel-domain containing protein [Muriicola sp. E247]|uniref:glycoside hydrolase family 2 TIM barrel-domain containing protein n=1 Tax=Muriicola sp. E247 TaxID=3242730 RepID=UPI00352436E7